MSTDLPRLTVVTPSLNQGQFLEATIQSVLSQNYPNLEYIVMDGGSTDQSVSILKRYDKRLAYWVSQPDGGMSVALNQGFARGTGDWLCWINSDDVYLPRAFERAARIMLANTAVEWISGGVIFADAHLNEWGRRLSRHHLGLPPQPPHITGTWTDLVADGTSHSFVSQPSSFWARRAYERCGPLDESQAWAMDYEYWIRMARGGLIPLCVPEYFSMRRFHQDANTVALAAKLMRTQLEIIDREIATASPEERPRLIAYRKWFAGRIWWRSILRQWNLKYAMPLVAAVKRRYPPAPYSPQT